MNIAGQAALAAGAMLIQDVTGVLLVQAEARERADLSALFDSIMWLAGIFTTTMSVTALQSGRLEAKTIVLVAVELANVAGCYIGVMVGRRVVRSKSCTCCPIHVHREAP